MLKKRERLTRRDMETLQKKGRRVHGTHMKLVYSPAPTSKCAVVVSKKTARTAVLRHTLRRRVFAALETCRAVRAGYHVAVILAPKAATRTVEELSIELRMLMEKIPSA